MAFVRDVQGSFEFIRLHRMFSCLKLSAKADKLVGPSDVAHRRYDNDALQDTLPVKVDAVDGRTYVARVDHKDVCLDDLPFTDECKICNTSGIRCGEAVNAAV